MARNGPSILLIRHGDTEWSRSGQHTSHTDLPLLDDGAPGGESLAAAAERIDRVIARAEDAGGDVALFGHGHILRILGARWLGLPPAAAAGLALSTASLCDLGYERERHVIWLWNDTSHHR
jgi:broad specificity phosphatase PhoE